MPYRFAARSVFLTLITLAVSSGAISAAVPGGASALQPATAAPSTLVGTWKGTMGALPAVELTIRESAGKLSGSMVMFVIGRSATGEPTVASKEDVSLVDPQWKDSRLTFTIKGPDGGNLRFEVKPTGADRAELQRTDDDNSNNDEPIVLRRAKG